MGKKHKKSNIYICEYCGSEHDGSYGSGRFCSASCSRRYSNTFVSEEGRNNQIKVLNSSDNREKLAKNRLEKKENYNKNETLLKHKKELKTNSTARIGKIGEYKVAAKFAERDIPVYLPMTETEEADIVAEFGGKLQKIQVKTSTTLGGVNNNVIKFRLTNSDHKVSHGKIKSQNKIYDIDSVDYFALYDLPDDEIYLVKNDGNKKNLWIRDKYPDTGQKMRINLANDYDIDYVLDLIENGINPDDIIICEELNNQEEI